MTSLVVLAGGGARRMGGRQKALLRVGERTILDRLLSLAGAGCAERVVVANRRRPLAAHLRRRGWEPAGGPGGRRGEWTYSRGGRLLRLIVDRRPGLGPVAGVEAGTGVLVRGSCDADPPAADACFVAACDFPFLTREVVLRTVARVRCGRADAAVPVAGGRLQPLAAAYAVPPARAAASSCLDAGERAVRAFLARLRVRRVPADDLVSGKPGSPDGSSGGLFLNVNRPADLRRARRRVAPGENRGRARAPDGGGREGARR